MNEDKFDIENIICENFVCDFQNLKDFRNSFRKKFKYIIAYHATNLSDEELNCVNKEGLKISSKDLLIKKAKHRFICNNTKDCRIEIENHINKYFSENELHTQNEINFALIKNDLFEHYHYLLFGSEALLPVADYLRIRYNKSFRKLLVESGSHYVIKVLIPVKNIEDNWINGIYEYFHESPFAISLVYHFNLPTENLIEFEKIERPIDRQNLISI